MNYSEMTDFEINKAVAIAEGHSCYYGDGSFTNGLMGRKVTVKGNGVVGCMDFCNSWADAGPIILSNKISLHAPSLLESWSAEFVGSDEDVNDGYEVDYFHHRDKNPLRAAMIVFLMMQEKPNAA